MKFNGQEGKGAIAVIVVLAIIAVVGYMLIKDDTSETLEEEEQQTTEVVEEVSETPKEQVEKVESLMFGEYLMPDEWEFTERAINSVRELDNKQEMQFGVVQHPVAKEVYYFATTSFDLDTDQTLNSVYQYNTKTLDWKRLYKRSDSPGDFQIGDLADDVIPVFHVLGYETSGAPDNARLVILVQNAEDSPGVCAEPWLLDEQDTDGWRQFISLDFSNPYAQSVYQVPEDVLEEARIREAKCLE